jgi:hypothetical protein
MERPSCGECAKRTTRCHYREQEQSRYEELRTRTTEHEELFELIRSLPEAEALDIVYRVRSNTNIEAVLAHAKNVDLIMQLSVVPESNRRYSFPYRLEMPSHLLDPHNPYLQSLLYNAIWTPEGKGRESISESSNPQSDVRARANAAYYKPFQAAELVEPLLSRVTAARWTTLNLSGPVPRLVKQLYSSYTSSAVLFPCATLLARHGGRKDSILHASPGAFSTWRCIRTCKLLLYHVYTDLEQMTYKRDRDRAQYWQPDNLGYRLLAEARRLWDLACTDRAKLTTIQAAIILNFTADVICIDHVRYLGTARLKC